MVDNHYWPLAFVVGVESAFDTFSVGEHLAGISARTPYREVVYCRTDLNGGVILPLSGG